MKRNGMTIALLGCLVTGLGPCASPFEDSALETYEVEVFPDFQRIAPVLARPAEPFVMANLLAFKELATGEGFEGLTGAEAYQIYTEGIQEAQAAIGSRLVWAGSVRSQVVGVSEPGFETLALLEYASPQSFLGIVTSPGEAPEARTAGLLGQWLIASTTLEEPEPSPPPTPAADPGGGVHAVTGLSPDQLRRLLAGPVDEPVAVVELLRFADASGELYRPYREALDAASEEVGGQRVWRGSFDSQVLGNAAPSFDEMEVRRYPSVRAYLGALRDPAVLAASPARADGLDLHWIYTADEAVGGLDP